MAKTRRLMASLSNVLRPAGGNKGKEFFGDIRDARRLLPQQPVTCPRDSAIRAVSVLQGFNSKDYRHNQIHAGSGRAGKSIKDELSEQELDKASGGITFNYGSLQIKYTPQKPDGTA